MIIALDVDEVCADLLTAWLNRYNKAYGDMLRVEDIDRWDITQQVQCGEEIYKFLTPDIYDEVLPLPGALETVERLRKMGRVIFVTNGNGEAKLSWLRRHGFLSSTGISDKDLFSCKDKSLIRCDYLFDDHIENVEALPGVGVLVTHHHNKKHPCSSPRLGGFGVSQAPQYVIWDQLRKGNWTVIPEVSESPFVLEGDK